MKLWKSVTLAIVLSLALGACFPFPDQPTPTTTPACNELNIPIDAVPVPIMEEGGFITLTITSSGDLELDFKNGQGYSGAVLLIPKLNVQGCTHLDINGTSTEDFKLTVEYRAQGGKTLARHQYQSVSAAPEPQTIRVPLEYDGIVDEIALLFDVKGEESKVTIKSINLK